MSNSLRFKIVLGAVFLTTAGLVGLSGCAGTATTGPGVPSGGGASNTPADLPADDPTPSAPAQPATCGQQTFPIASVKKSPNVLLIVDNSTSMLQGVPNTNQSKWDTLKTAVQALLTRYDGDARWGLSIFPDPTSGNSCQPGKIDLPIADKNEQPILNRLAMYTNNNIGGNTPTEQTLLEAERNGGLDDKAHENYIVLLTDGLPTCNQQGRVTPVVTSLFNRGVKTFVIGLGSGTQSNGGELDRWATAGGTARTNAPQKYYQANDAKQLQQAFDSIVGSVASCTYTLASAPPDPKLIAPTLDGKPVAADPVNGFTYDPAGPSIVFHGSSCDLVKMGGATKVDIVYGCPAPTIN